MDRITQLLGPTNTNYAPLETHAGAEGESFMNEQGQDADESGTTEGAHEAHLEAPFSWTHYLVFLLLGVAMLWAWYGSVLLAIYVLSNANQEQEYVPSSRTILSITVSKQHMDTSKLSVSRVDSVNSHKPRHHGHPHEKASQCIVPKADHPGFDD